MALFKQVFQAVVYTNLWLKGARKEASNVQKIRNVNVKEANGFVDEMEISAGGEKKFNPF
jgi:hypothetical protein